MKKQEIYITDYQLAKSFGCLTSDDETEEEYIVRIQEEQSRRVYVFSNSDYREHCIGY